MSFLDSTIAQPSSQLNLGYTRLQQCIDGKITNYSLLQYEERRASFWKPSQNPRKMNLCLGHQKKPRPEFLVKAITTFEPKTCLFVSEDGRKENNALPCIAESVSSTVYVGSSGADSEEIDAKEKLRRMRISKANEGNIPWNKGKKHSPETVQRIRERTKLAMQNPKVKMKLASMGHVQSQETREKIGLGVRMCWKRRHQKLVFQETCLFDWQNLIADAARKGFQDGEELQWDSYEIMKEQLQNEWLDSIEYRKTMVRPRSSRRAPKPLEQRRKIAEAIAAKWADPEYRVRVQTGWAKYHKTHEGATTRKVTRKPSDEGHSRKTPKKKISDAEESNANELKAKPQQPKLKYVPKYKDPLTSSKLEILKSIRAQRVAKKNETLEQARIMIAEAKKAADILEMVAMRSPVAKASLTESRKLIAEAAQTIERIENGNIGSHHDASSGHDKSIVVKKNGYAIAKVPNEENSKGVNGIAFHHSGQGKNLGFDLYKLRMMNKLDMNNHLPGKLGRYEFPKVECLNPTTDWFGSHHRKIWRDPDEINLTPTSKDHTFWKHIKEFEHGDAIQKSEHHHLHELNGIAKLNGSYATNGAKMQLHESPPPRTITKKWVHGRLVVVVEGE